MRQIRPARRWPGSLQTLDSRRLYMPELALEAYGERAKWPNSSLTAFAYCYRRFGPPPIGTDDYKQLAGTWILKTRDPEVYLSIDPGGCYISLFMTCYVSERLHTESRRPGNEWRAEARRRFFEMHPGATDADWFHARFDDEQPWTSHLPDFSRCPESISGRALAAIRHALLDLLRPCFVRDVPINMFGEISEGNPSRGPVAPRSHLAGLGVPVRQMEKRLRRST